MCLGNCIVVSHVVAGHFEDCVVVSHVVISCSLFSHVVIGPVVVSFAVFNCA